MLSMLAQAAAIAVSASPAVAAIAVSASPAAAAGAPVVHSIPLQWFLIVSVALFSVGSAGVLARRNALTVLMSVEIMLNAVNLAFLAFAREWGNMHGHVVTFFVIAVAAAEAAIGLALVLGIFRHKKSINLDEMNALKN